jgi:hypothetical protein
LVIRACFGFRASNFVFDSATPWVVSQAHVRSFSFSADERVQRAKGKGKGWFYGGVLMCPATMRAGCDAYQTIGYWKALPYTGMVTLPHA